MTIADIISTNCVDLVTYVWGRRGTIIAGQFVFRSTRPGTRTLSSSIELYMPTTVPVYFPNSFGLHLLIMWSKVESNALVRCSHARKVSIDILGWMRNWKTALAMDMRTCKSVDRDYICLSPAVRRLWIPFKSDIGPLDIEGWICYSPWSETTIFFSLLTSASWRNRSARSHANSLAPITSMSARVSSFSVRIEIQTRKVAELQYIHSPSPRIQIPSSFRGTDIDHEFVEGHYNPHNVVP